MDCDITTTTVPTKGSGALPGYINGLIFQQKEAFFNEKKASFPKI